MLRFIAYFNNIISKEHNETHNILGFEFRVFLLQDVVSQAKSPKA